MHIYHYIQHICERQGLLFYLHVLLVGEGPLQLMILSWVPISISQSLVGSALFGTQMVQRWTKALVLVLVVLMSILSICGLWEGFRLFF